MDEGNGAVEGNNTTHAHAHSKATPARSYLQQTSPRKAIAGGGVPESLLRCNGGGALVTLHCYCSTAASSLH